MDTVIVTVDKLNIKTVERRNLPMSVKKIFIILITVVACVMLGALILNVLMPNVMTTIVNSVENMVYNATAMSFDFNGDGKSGGKGTQTTKYKVDDNEGAGDGDKVDGFSDGMQ